MMYYIYGLVLVGTFVTFAAAILMLITWNARTRYRAVPVAVVSAPAEPAKEDPKPEPKNAPAKDSHGHHHEDKHGGGMSKMKIALGIVAVVIFAAATIGALWYKDVLSTPDIQNGLTWLKANWPLLIIGACALMVVALFAKKHWKWIGFLALAVVAANYLHLWTFGAQLFQSISTNEEKILGNTFIIPAGKSVPVSIQETCSVDSFTKERKTELGITIEERDGNLWYSANKVNYDLKAKIWFYRANDCIKDYPKVKPFLI